MKNRILRTAVILATAATMFHSGCGDNGESSDVRGGGNVDALINRTRGTNDPKAPELYTLSVTQNPESGGSVSKSPDKEQYTSGESVMIIVTPETGYRFTGWSGSLMSPDHAITIPMDGNKELIANFIPVNAVSYTLNIIANPETGGATSKSPDKLEYAASEAVYVTATAGIGYRFAGWSGSLASQNAEITVTMDDNKELIANFVPVNVATYTLTVNANPAIGGIVSKSPNKSEYTAGETVTVTATAYSAGYTFIGWSGASSSKDATVTITMDGSKELIANFAPRTYTLTINAGNGGSVSSDPGKSAYMYGEEVTITAYPANSYRFTGWSGVATGTGNPITVTMNSDKYLAANFEWQGTEPPPMVTDTVYTLTIYQSPSDGGGTVFTNPYKTSYNANEKVYVTAEAAECYRFVGWLGASASQNTDVTITMDGNKELIASFEALVYTLTATANPSTYGSVSRNPGQAYYCHGTAVTVTASAYSGYRFTGWTGASSTSTSVAITMDGNRTVTANFEQIPTYSVTFSANGGTVSPTSGTTGTDGRLASLPMPTRTGYTFNGWYTAAMGGTAVAPGTVFNATTTIYAQWTVISGEGNTFVDGRDGKTYKRVVIGNQVWMGENLNYDVPNTTSDDVCYGNDDANCAQYGRLYYWVTAMDIDASYNSTYWNGSDVNHQGVCPAGWHLPSNAEWTTLVDYVGYVGGTSTTGTKLKSSTGWNSSGVPAGTDNYGFTALPGGLGYGYGRFRDAGNYGLWWSTTETEIGASYAEGQQMYYGNEIVHRYTIDKTNLFSVRCVQDD